MSTPRPPRHLTPLDIEKYMLSIDPDSVPPELVAQAVVLMAPLRIPPHVAQIRLFELLCSAMVVMLDASGVSWNERLRVLSSQQGWRAAQDWTPETLREFIDQTITHHCGETV